MWGMTASVPISECFIVQKLSQEICVPKSCRNKQTFCCLLDVYSGVFDMITESGILDKKLWGSLEARHTASFLRAIPRSSNSDTAKITRLQYFLRPVNWLFCTQKYERTQRSKCVAVRMYNRKDDGASGEISALRELSPSTIAFTGKCNIPDALTYCAFLVF